VVLEAMSITRFGSMFRQYPNVMHIARTHARFMATSTTLQSEHRVILDNQTLYVDQSLAEALGWKPEEGSDAGIESSLSGWGPTYFTIAPTGSENGESQCIDISIVLILLCLARAVVESSHNPNVKRVLDYLKER